MPAEIPKFACRESASRNTQICQLGNLPGRNLPGEIPKSASQEICLGGICQQKYPNLPVKRSAWGESASGNTQICQSGNLLGESSRRNIQICHSGNLPGRICQQKYPNLPIRKSAWGNLLAEIPKSASQNICLGGISWQKYLNLPVRISAWGESVSGNTQICQSGYLPWKNLPEEIPKSSSQVICLGGFCQQKYPNLPVR